MYKYVEIVGCIGISLIVLGYLYCYFCRSGGETLATRTKTWSVPARLTVKAYDEQDAVKQALESIEDGLIEPGFVEDGGIDGEGKIFELESGE